MKVKIPATPGDITGPWLTAALRSTGVLKDEQVIEVEPEVIGQEWGFTGVIARLRLTYAPNSDGRLPRTLIAKLLHAEREVASGYQVAQSVSAEARRAMLERAAREVRFYEEIVPESHASVPSVLFGGVDPGSHAAVLILEDVWDGSVGDALSGCSLREAELVVREIGSIHAQWWAHRSLAEKTWLERPAQDAAARQRRYADALPSFLQRHGERLPDAFRRLLDVLGSRLVPVLEASIAAPTTLIHADLHLDNVIFVPSWRGAGVKIIDWQSVTTGPGAQDIATFLSGSLDPEEQFESGGRLLDLYHAVLLEGGVTGYGRDDLERDYRLWLLRVVAGVVIWLGTADLHRLAGREKALVEAAIGDGRLIAAAQAHHLLSAIPS